MRVVVASAHRSHAGRVKNYMRQVADLRDEIAGIAHVRVIAAEGDSTDGTREALIKQSRVNHLDLELLDVSHGGPQYGSTEQPERMAQLSKIANSIFDAVRLDDDMVFYVESDLLWVPAAAIALINNAYHAHFSYDIWAPLVMAGDLFYDVWAYRDLDGNRLSPFPPHHSRLGSSLCPMELSSAGSCLAMRAEIARSVRIHDDNALVGWCSRARQLGYRIAVDPSVIIRHPA